MVAKEIAATLLEPFKKYITDASDDVMIWRSQKIGFEKEMESSDDKDKKTLLSNQSVVVEHRTR
jgi:hypothetical protein